LKPWLKIPAQIDAVEASTQLVTVTIGGNDVSYLGRMVGAACRQLAAEDAKATSRCPRFPAPEETDYADLAASLDLIAQAVKVRAPDARLVFVAYPDILSRSQLCAATPIPAAEAEVLRETARRLAKATAKAARRNKAVFIDSPRLSREHGACDREPWVEGYVTSTGAPFHPNLAGMTALADALDRRLPR
jgi:lysophospholipase L1-like esterase